MTPPTHPPTDDWPLAVAPRLAGPVLVGLASSQGLTSVVADIDGGHRTVISSSSKAVNSFLALVEELRSRGEEVEEPTLTAAGVAAVAEADRILPSKTVWVPETCVDGPRYRLPAPQEAIPMCLGTVLLNRRSARKFEALSGADLSAVLFHSARIRTAWAADDGYPASSRPAPSAGARHPIDIIVIPRRLSGFDPPSRGASASYLFDPMTCELVGLTGSVDRWYSRCPDVAAELMGECPAVLLALAARVERTLWRYRGGMSLIYRDAGCLAATLGVVSAGLGLACRPLARSAPSPVDEPDAPTFWVDVGGVALGGRASR